VDHFPGETSTLNEIGRCHHSTGDYQQALDSFRLLLLRAKASSNKRMMSYALRGLGMAYDAEGKKARALAYYRQAIPLQQSGKDRRGEALTLNLAGRIHQELGRPREALKYFQRALHLYQAAGDRLRESLTLYNIACAERDRGHLKQALGQIEAALQIVESLRTKVGSRDLRTSYFASIQQYYELDIDLLMRQPERPPSKSFAAAALEASERARARSLLELLAEARADIRSDADQAMIEQARSLQQRINALAERKMKLLSANAAQDEINTVIKEVVSLTAERGQVEAQIRIKSPRYAALTQPKPSSLKEIQQLLDDDTLLLEYSLGGERSYLWAVTRTGLKSYELPSRAEIEKAARPVYDLLAPPQPASEQPGKQREAEYWRQASALSRIVLKPVADQLGHKRLLIVADGVLQYIPFAALPIPERGRGGHKGTRAIRNPQSAIRNPQFQSPNPQFVPLMFEHEVVNLPSASTLVVLRRETAGRRRAPKAVAALADPVFEADDIRVLAATGKVKVAPGKQTPANFPLPLSRLRGMKRDGGFGRLPATLNEAMAIEEVTTESERLIAKGFDASRARATDPALSQYRIIHFATHGILDRDNPELSAIVLSLVDRQGRSQEGYLRLHDIYNLNLPADLVVLSACNTGLGKEFKGEGLIGLTRGFMYAGAARVMASLWKVEDEPTAKLMRHFYRHMLKDGLPPAAALRQAQIALWQDAEWRAPYFWAAFVIQGEWR
jgi:CHAT domain-containing protein